MIVAILIAYWVLGAVAWRMFGKQYASLTDVFWWYPIGLSLSGLYFFAAWWSSLPFIFFVYFWWIAALLSSVWCIKIGLFQQITGDVQEKMRKIPVVVPALLWWQWPLLFFSAAIALSLFIALFWQTFLHPVGWDSVALYDFRALRIAEGWKAQNFMMQFRHIPDYRAYDFLHPMTSSLWWAHAYISGASHVLFLYSTLLASVLALGWSVWRQRASQIMWAFLWLGFPAIFVSLTEGYGVYPATLFTVFALLWWSIQSNQAERNLTMSDWSIFSVLLLGSTAGRITEYFWLILFIWSFSFLTMKNVKRFSLHYLKAVYAIVALPGLHLFWWFVLRSQAVSVSGSLDADRSVSSLLRALQSISMSQVVSAFLQEFSSWAANPTTLWLLLSILGITWLVVSKKQRITYWIWLLVLAGMLLLVLYAGMVVMHIVFAERWVEAKQAMDRASMPILALCFLLLTDVTERMTRLWTEDSSKNVIS